MARKQVRPLSGPEPLIVSNFIPDHYFRPRPQTDHIAKLRILQQAVGVFGSAASAFGKLGQESPQARQQRELSELAEAEKLRASMTSDAYIEAVKSGQIPIHPDSRVGNFFQQEYGRTLVQSQMQKLQDEINSGSFKDINDPHFNPEATLLKRMAPVWASVQGLPHAQIQAGRAIHKARQALINQRNERRGKAARQAMQSAVYNRFVEGLNSAGAEGLRGDILLERMREMWKNAGPPSEDGLFGLTKPEIDEQHLNALATVAPKYPELVIGQLQARRQDVRDPGNKLPSYLETPRHIAKARQILGAAQKAADAAEINAQRLDLRKKNSELFRGSSPFFRSIQSTTLSGKYGTTQQYTESQQKQEAIAESFRTMAEETGRLPSSEEMLSLYNRADEPNAAWIAQLENGYASITSELASGKLDQSAMARASQSIDLYLELARSSNGHEYIQRHLKTPEARRFFKFAFGMSRFGNFSTESIVRLWSSALTTNPDTIRRITLPEVEKHLELQTGSWWDIFSSIDNKSAVAKQITDEVSVLVRSGMPLETAVKFISNQMNKTLTVINDWAVPSDGFLTKEHEPYINDRLKAVWKEFKNQIIAGSSFSDTDDWTDLSLKPGPYRTWYIVRKEDGLPIDVVLEGAEPSMEGVAIDRGLAGARGQVARLKIHSVDIQKWENDKKTQEIEQRPETIRRIRKTREMFEKVSPFPPGTIR